MAARHLPPVLALNPEGASGRHRRGAPVSRVLIIAFLTLVAAVVVGCFSYAAYDNVVIAVFAGLPICVAGPVILRSLVD